jgi:predicted transposase YbfD/YdcC
MDNVDTADNADYTQHHSCESGHPRIESRTVWQFPAAQIFSPQQQRAWAGLRNLVVIHSERRLGDRVTSEVRYFLSPFSVDAQTFSGYIRSHWGIENQLHWCLDVVFNEDACRIRKDHAPRNFSLLRRLALNLLRQEPSKASLSMCPAGAAEKRYRAGLDNQFMLQILSSALSKSDAPHEPEF